ncbi:hypothetical protein [Rhizobium sp. NFR07]|uniref:hypothetical protein n=1 Tax=Rhizobium sp. NFR07 TaxID=1566262 RepID=UPI00116085B8|nr:hypothetical protein [Rhizobium sp. NFR07]
MNAIGNGPDSDSKSVTPTAAAGALQAVSMRGDIGRTVGPARTASNNVQVCRTRDYISDDAAISGGLVLYFSAKRVGAGVEVDGDAHALRADIEINGVCVAVTFDGGATSKAISNGAVLVPCDPVPPSAFGLAKFEAGTLFWRKVERTFAVGGAPVYWRTQGNTPGIAGENAFSGAAGTAVSKIGVAGAMTTAGSWTALTAFWGPDLVAGVPDGPMRAVYTYGASLEEGQKDNGGDGASGAGGYIRRGLANVGGKKVAGVNVGMGGERADQFVSTSAYRRQLSAFCNIGLNGYGGNDFSSNRNKEATSASLDQCDAIIKLLLIGGKRIGRLVWHRSPTAPIAGRPSQIRPFARASLISAPIWTHPQRHSLPMAR